MASTHGRKYVINTSPSFDVCVLLCVLRAARVYVIPSLLALSFTGYSRKIQITVFQRVVGSCGSEFVLNLPLLLRASASSSVPVHCLSLSAHVTLIFLSLSLFTFSTPFLLIQFKHALNGFPVASDYIQIRGSEAAGVTLSDIEGLPGAALPSLLTFHLSARAAASRRLHGSAGRIHATSKNTSILWL